MIHETHNPSIYELTIRFVEIIIWPVVFFIIILLFRGNFKDAMGRLGSIKADATGVALSFTNVLGNAEKKFEKTRKVAVAKAATSIGDDKSDKRQPYEQLIEIKESLDKTIRDLAKEEGISRSNKSTIDLCDELVDGNVISSENGDLMHTLIEVVNAARTDITQAQVNKIKALWKSI